MGSAGVSGKRVPYGGGVLAASSSLPNLLAAACPSRFPIGGKALNRARTARGGGADQFVSGRGRIAHDEHQSKTGSIQFHHRPSGRGLGATAVADDVHCPPAPPTLGPARSVQAILDANALRRAAMRSPSTCRAAGPFTIMPMTPLPDVTDTLSVDGTTQSGFDASTGAPIVILNGASAGNDISGNTLWGPGADGSTVRGLEVVGFSGQGVDLEGASNCVVAGNYIGTDGASALPNTAGVAINSLQQWSPTSGPTSIAATDDRVGGTTPADRNVISGNTGVGVALDGEGVTGNVVEGNFIGTDASGTAPVPNGNIGVAVMATPSHNVIGGTAPGAGNVIAFNQGVGVGLEGQDGSGPNPGQYDVGNSILSNSIYSDASPGIDLSASYSMDGVTPNHPGDADSGPDDFQNYTCDCVGTGRRQRCHPNCRLAQQRARCTTFLVQFFASPDSDPSGFGQGRTLDGSVTVTTDGDGNAGFSLDLHQQP